MSLAADHYRNLEAMYLEANINREVYNGVKIEISEGQAKITHKVERKFFHAAGSLHGSFYFKMLDDAAFFAASSLIEDEFLFTISFQTQLVRPLTEGTIKSVGSIVKPGKTLLIAQSVLTDQNGKTVGYGQGQFMKSGKQLSDMKGYKI